MLKPTRPACGFWLLSSATPSRSMVQKVASQPEARETNLSQTSDQFPLEKKGTSFCPICLWVKTQETPGEHQNRCYMGVHPPQNGICIGSEPWSHLKRKLPQRNRQRSGPSDTGNEDGTRRDSPDLDSAYSTLQTARPILYKPALLSAHQF